MPKPSNIAEVRCFLGFDYEVESKKGSENVNVDCLSRAPKNQQYYSTDITINEKVYQLCYSTIFEISSEKLIAKSIAQETDKDKVLSKIKKNLL
ncbi:integrase core domain protein [Lasius niger]|uniref:Integrase core domain protein n=1 Tax=Lasius niger TaxID=67767 RepID=A0A0J7K5B9_LASNI|nr:integrase core domain protein [Lasius niger]